MAITYRAERSHDPAAAVRDRVRLLGHPDRRRSEAIRVRVNLARASRIGLRERLAHPDLSRHASV
jgi:hypothetical protein